MKILYPPDIIKALDSLASDITGDIPAVVELSADEWESAVRWNMTLAGKDPDDFYLVFEAAYKGIRLVAKA